MTSFTKQVVNAKRIYEQVGTGCCTLVQGSSTVASVRSIISKLRPIITIPYKESPLLQTHSIDMQ